MLQLMLGLFVVFVKVTETKVEEKRSIDRTNENKKVEEEEEKILWTERRGEGKGDSYALVFKLDILKKHNK